MTVVVRDAQADAEEPTTKAKAECWAAHTLRPCQTHFLLIIVRPRPLFRPKPLPLLPCTFPVEGRGGEK